MGNKLQDLSPKLAHAFRDKEGGGEESNLSEKLEKTKTIKDERNEGRELEVRRRLMTSFRQLNDA